MSIYNPLLPFIKVDIPEEVDPATIGETLTAQAGVLGAVLIGVGFVFCFFGIRIFKIVCFLCGIYFGALLSYVVLANIEPAEGFANRENVYLFTCLGVGVVVGFAFICVWRLGLVALGGLFGFFVALIILSFKSGGLIDQNPGRTIFILVLVIVGGVVIFLLERHFIIISTAISGSFSMVYGVDVFINRGFTEAVVNFLGGQYKNIQDYVTTTEVYIMLASVLGIALVGIVVQYKISSNHQHRKKE